MSVRRAAASTLLALVMRNKRAQADLLQYDAKSKDLFGSFLVACGDYTTQVSGHTGVL